MSRLWKGLRAIVWGADRQTAQYLKRGELSSLPVMPREPTMGSWSYPKESISQNVDQLWNHVGTCDKHGFLVSTSGLWHRTSWRLRAWGCTLRTVSRWCFCARGLRTWVWDGGSQPQLHVWTAWTQRWRQTGPRIVASMDLSIHLPKAWRIQRWQALLRWQTLKSTGGQEPWVSGRESQGLRQERTTC